jgi:hypothetical protein
MSDPITLPLDYESGSATTNTTVKNGLIAVEGAGATLY